MNNKFLGFTLAEVLITIGIIGVVSAITIPSLLTNVRNKDLQAQLKKTYSEWNQVAMQFMNDHEQSIPDYTSEYGLNAMINELPKYVKGFSKFSDWTWDDVGDKENATENTPYPIYSLRNGSKTRVITACDVSGYRNDISGKYILFDDQPVAGFNGPRLCIDLNGDKRPNTLGLDIFYFLFTTDGHIIPEGTDHPDNNYGRGYASGAGTIKAESQYCNGIWGKNALGCAYYAINDISPKGNGTYWKDFIGKKQYK